MSTHSHRRRRPDEGSMVTCGMRPSVYKVGTCDLDLTVEVKSVGEMRLPL